MFFAITPPMKSLKEKIENLEKQMIINALNESNWVKAEASRMLGITERMIGYKIKKHGIKEEVGQENYELRVKEQKLRRKKQLINSN